MTSKRAHGGPKAPTPGWDIGCGFDPHPLIAPQRGLGAAPKFCGEREKWADSRGDGGGRLCSHPPVFLFPLVEGFFPAANVAPLRVNGRGVMGGEGGPPGCTSPLDAFRRREGIIHREKELKLRRKGKGKEPGAARKGPELAATKMSRSEK